jgi:hypothetical protein
LSASPFVQFLSSIVERTNDLVGRPHERQRIELRDECEVGDLSSYPASGDA